MDTKRVREALKELEHAGNADRVVEVLTDLQDNFKPTKEVLRETKIGVAVNKLRSHADPRVSGLVKKLVSAWRETVQQQKTAETKPAASEAKAGGAEARAEARAAPAVPSDKKRDWKTDGADTNVYSEPVRNSCIQVTYNALAIGSGEPVAKVLRAAKDVEQAVFEHEKATTPGYRNKMRSLYMYLKDPKNPMLRQQVVSGNISGERLRGMKPQEMANDELKKEMETIEKQNLFNAQSAQEQRATTDRFTCGKCKHKKVSYYQMQTRSADEPLTTFCTCENCGNRWKFS